MARYVSNLTAPDLRKHFKLCDPPMRIGNEDMPSDPDYESACLYWGWDEAAILYNCAVRIQKHRWLDIGARFGWTAAHLMAAGHSVAMVDPHFQLEARLLRMMENVKHAEGYWRAYGDTGQDVIDQYQVNGCKFDGFVIDGNHDAPEPLLDAQGCARIAAATAVIMLHDAYGDPTREAAKWLMSSGWKARFYWTPNGVIACWRGEGFAPPDHVRDPAIDWTGFEKLVYEDIPKGEWA